ncbi:hypothetical protein GGR56DRAFT_332227 [Xylariaceae sp. FL0804]|nr:hypothetical protein GGR56DRAFT_332227 [Xylariaceae sp. FL0804]
MLKIGEQDPTFLWEVWILFTIGASLLLTRFAVRIKTVGFRGLQGDDLFALLTLAMYTMDAATVHIIYHTATNVEAVAYAENHELTQAEIDQFVYGSKEQLTAWYSYTALIWCLKGTMLCFLNRMTMGSTHHKVIKYLSIACAVSYIAVFCTLTFGCWPYHKNWQVVPDPGLKCTFKLQNFLVSVVLNVITDASILCIPLPLLWTLQIPLRKKIVIAILLSSGLFVISAALIRVILTVSANPSALTINRWGVRETIVGIISVNIPILRPLFTRAFWSGRPDLGLPSGGSCKSRGATGASASTGIHGPYELALSTHKGRGGSDDVFKDSSVNGSKELIVDKSNADGRNTDSWSGSGLGTTTTIAYRGEDAV